MNPARLLLIACLTVTAHLYGEGHKGAGIKVEDSAMGKDIIKWVTPESVDVEGLFSPAVVNLRTQAPAPKPEKSVTFDDKQKPKLGDPFPTGVSFSQGEGKPPFEGLMQSQADPKTGAVATLTLPTDPPVTVQNPTKPDGSPVSQRDFANLGQGVIPNLTVLSQGRSWTFNAPSRRQPG